MALDPELIAFLDKYFRETQKLVKDEVQGLREETRHLGVRIEGLQSQIQTVAEGVLGNNERLDAFRLEVAREFREVRATMQTHYRGLDRRITRLESRAGLKAVKRAAAKKVAVKKASRGN